MDVPARVTQEEVYTGFLHLPSAALVLIFLGVAGNLIHTHAYKPTYILSFFSRIERDPVSEGYLLAPRAPVLRQLNPSTWTI